VVLAAASGANGNTSAYVNVETDHRCPAGVTLDLLSAEVLRAMRAEELHNVPFRDQELAGEIVIPVDRTEPDRTSLPDRCLDREPYAGFIIDQVGFIHQRFAAVRTVNRQGNDLAHSGMLLIRLFYIKFRIISAIIKQDVELR
jgi:hypothetical protein